MKNKFKKILTTTLISAATLSLIGCGTPNSKLAKNIDKGVADFVSSINNLDYVDTGVKSKSNIGKIVETAAAINAFDDQYLTKTLEELENDNAITLPSEHEDNFKLFVLSESPYIMFTTSDNGASLNMQLNFSTDKIAETSDEINTKINNLILKRSILMIYVNEIYNNRVNLSDENRTAINAYVNVIKENASYLNGNRGMVKNQLTLANDLIVNKSNDNLVNYYMIKSGEALETRSSKIDSTISAMESIINIIETNLDTSSIYYNVNLSDTYEDILSNLKNSNNTQTTIVENKEVADNITNSLKLANFEESTTNNNQQSTLSRAKNTTNKTKTICIDGNCKTITNENNTTNSNINNSTLSRNINQNNSTQNNCIDGNCETITNENNTTNSNINNSTLSRNINQNNSTQNNCIDGNCETKLDKNENSEKANSALTKARIATQNNSQINQNLISNNKSNLSSNTRTTNETYLNKNLTSEQNNLTQNNLNRSNISQNKNQTNINQTQDNTKNIANNSSSQMQNNSRNITNNNSTSMPNNNFKENRKNANSHNINRKNHQNLQNLAENQNNSSANQTRNMPRTFDIKPNERDLNNETKLNEIQDKNEKQIASHNENINSQINHSRNSTSDRLNAHSHEEIKRVPYIKTID